MSKVEDLKVIIEKADSLISKLYASTYLGKKVFDEYVDWKIAKHSIFEEQEEDKDV